MTNEKYVGYRAQDYQASYAKHFAPSAVLKPALAVSEALQDTSRAAGKLPAFEQAVTLLQTGYAAIENGFTLEPDGSARLAILTPMPNVTPLMWHWWFGWHGDQDSKYKLWHPKAHVSAVWADDLQDKYEHIGRTSHIQEYIGKSLEKAAIQFIAPATLWLPAASDEQIFICARIGYSNFPLDYGWLVHQVRAVPGGAEMRSRFWLGGKHIKLRTSNPLGAMASGLIQKLKTVAPQQAIDLGTHCSEEMNYLATFLPALYAEFQEANHQ